MNLHNLPDYKKGKRKKHSTDQLLFHLKELAFKLGHTPSCNEINKEGKFTHTMYLTCFGTVKNAQARAGLLPNNQFNSFQNARRTVNYITTEECISDVSRMQSQLGEMPSLYQLKRLGKYPYMLYYRRLGGIRKIKELAL